MEDNVHPVSVNRWAPSEQVASVFFPTFPVPNGIASSASPKMFGMFGVPGTSESLGTLESEWPAVGVAQTEFADFLTSSAENVTKSDQLMTKKREWITPDPATDGLFPMMMAPFEYYMWVDHKPEYPMVVAAMLQFEGEMEREAFELSVRNMAARHPFVSCTIDLSTQPLPTWIYHRELLPRIQWERVDHFPEEGELTPPWIDLTQESGMRFRVCVCRGKTQLFLYMHHSVSDGLGLFRMLGDLLAFYGRQYGDEIALPELDVKTLTRRKSYAQSMLPKFRGLRTTLRRTLSFLRWVIIPPAPIVAPSEKPLRKTPESRTWFPVPTIHLPMEDVVRLRTKAKAAQTTLNVLLMRDLTDAVAQWNMERGSRAGKSYWLRIGLPVSMRGDIHEKIPASNVVSYLFPIRRLCEKTLQRKSLLHSLQSEVQEIYTEFRALYFARLLNRTRNHPWIIRAFVGSRTCFATAIHSYLGDFPRRFEREFPMGTDGRFRVGNLQFEKILSTPPVRPRTSLAVGYHQYRGAMDICLRFDPHRFTQQDASDFTEMFRQKIRLSLTEN